LEDLAANTKVGERLGRRKGKEITNTLDKIVPNAGRRDGWFTSRFGLVEEKKDKSRFLSNPAQESLG